MIIGTTSGMFRSNIRNTA